MARKRRVEKWAEIFNRLKAAENWQKLLEEASQCIEEWPDEAVGYTARATARAALGKYEEAVTDYDKAIELEPENHHFHSGRAIAYASITAAKTQKAFEEKYESQLGASKSISAIIENYTKDIEFLERRLYGESSSGVGPPSGKLRRIWFHLSRWFLNYLDKELITWIMQAEKASGRARLYLIGIAAVSYGGFFFLHKVPDQYAIGDISFLDILQLNAFVLLLYSPFLLFNKHLSDRANRMTTLLYALKRDRDRLLFWAGLEDVDEKTIESRLALTVLKHLNTNSAADISVKMMHNRRAWRGTQIEKMPEDISLKIAAKLDEIEKAIKKTSP